MPLKAFQQNYWITSSTVAPPPTPASRGGYPGFQISVVGSLFGALGVLCQVWWERLIWWATTKTAFGGTVALARRLHQLPTVEQQVATRVVGLMEDDRFPLARLAVQQTATTLGFQRPEAWRSLTHLLKEDQGRAENMYRHVQATETFKALTREASSTATNPQAQLLVELAYHAYTITGRR